MEQDTLDNRSRTSSMAKVLIHGLMVQNMKGITLMARNMVRELSTLPTDPGFKEISTEMTSKDMESIFGLTNANMKEIGLRTKCTGKERLFGQMEGSTKAIILKIKKRALEHLNGRTEENILDNRKEENSTKGESASLQMEKKNSVNVSMANVQDGSKTVKTTNLSR